MALLALGRDASNMVFMVPIIIAVTWGALHYIARDVSGGHINPLFSIGMCIAGRMSFGTMLGYVIVQILGAILAVWLATWLFGLSKSQMTSSLGLYGPISNINSWKAFIVEFVGSAILIFAFVVITANPINYLTGFIVMTMVYFFVSAMALPYTGALLNPARLFATTLFSGQWSVFFVYLVAAILACLLAILLRFLLRDADCTPLVDACGKPVLNSCGKQILKCEKPMTDECGNQDPCNRLTYYKTKVATDYRQASPLSVAKNYLDSHGLNPDHIGAYIAKSAKTVLSPGTVESIEMGNTNLDDIVAAVASSSKAKQV